MPVPYRASSFRQPVRQAPPLPPSTPEDLEAIMVKEMGPRREPNAYAPLPRSVPRSCRFHPRVHSTAAIYRGPTNAENGWVLLCPTCVSALVARTLRVLDTLGRYTGAIPSSHVLPKPIKGT